MDAREMLMFSTVCTNLEVKFRNLADVGETEMPFSPLEVAEALSVAAKDLRPGPLVVEPK